MKRQTLYPVLAVLLLFALSEIVLRVALPLGLRLRQKKSDLQYEYRLWQSHLFDSFMGIHESDPDLFWKLKPNHRSALLETNAEGFIGPPIAYKQPGEFRILFLGDSTPLGLGLPNLRHSFVFQLELLLTEAHLGQSIRVINTSTAGYTSWQCRRLLELKGEKLQPDLVITYFGNNDPSINGFLSDRELSELTSSYSAVKKVLNKSYIYRLLKLLLLSLKERSPENRQLQARVSLSEFVDNLRAISDWCREHRSKLLICTIPTPLLWPPGIQFRVFAGGRDETGRLVMAEEMIKQITDQWSLCLDTTLLPGQHDWWVQKVYGSSYADSGDLEFVENRYRFLLDRESDQPLLWNNLGVVLWRQGKNPLPEFEKALAFDSLSPTLYYNKGVSLFRTDPEKAGQFLKIAKEIDNYSLRIKETYNTEYRRFAGESGIPLADLEKLFAGLPEQDCFVDHCHPTEEGHKLLAERLFEILEQSFFQ